MSILKVLKEYLIGEDGYLLNDNNNGKTVMLSGAWGSGKTHFWQNEIEGELTRQLNPNNKACVYISLYGKDNIEAIKNEILFKAYESIKDENKIAKRAISAFGFTSRLLSVSYGGVRGNTGTIGDVVENFFESKKINEAESFLADGGLICLDDFERKSKHIDLNDLFGFIAQLAIDMNCKVVIILNSDVFEGEEANVFKTVKEKTVNKFFYFEPTVEELFNSIYNSNEKYQRLNDYKDEILSAIKETEELNARIYIQVLDNCLEWIDKGYESSAFRTLVHITFNFILNHIILDKGYIDVNNNKEKGFLFDYEYKIIHNVLDTLSRQRISEINHISSQKKDNNRNENSKIQSFSNQSEYVETLKDIKYPDFQEKFNDAVYGPDYNGIKEDKIDGKYIYQIWKYGYQLYNCTIDDNTYTCIANFIKTGILSKKPKEVESSLPPKVDAP